MKAPATAEATRPPLFLLLSIGLAHLLRWGYAYGTGDHDEMIPQVLHALDPDLFRRDWFVMGQADLLNVRSAYVQLLRMLGIVLPLPLAVALVHMMVVLALAYGVYRLSLTLVPDRLGAALGTVMAVVLVADWTLGGNALTYDKLLPEALAWALILPALRRFVEGQRWRPALLIAAAAWFQLLAGLQTTLVLGLLGLWSAAQHRDARAATRVVGFGWLVTLLAAPLILAVLFTPADPEAATVAHHPMFYVMVVLRNPHHYLPTAFARGDYVRFALILAFGLLAFRALHHRGRLHHSAFIARLLIIASILCAVTAFFGEVVPVLFIVRLQFFKLTVLVTTLLALLVGHVLAARLTPRVRAVAEQMLEARRTGLLVVGIALVMIGSLIAAGIPPVSERYAPAQHAASNLGTVERWAEQHLPLDALVLIPPSNSSFRTWAQRSVVANYKPTPFQNGAMHVWLDRLQTVAPMPLPTHGRGFAEALDAAYAANDAAAWHRLALRFGATHALVDLSHTPDPPAGKPLTRQGAWALYALDPSSP